MDLRQLEAFVAVCDEGSFTAAAQRCGIAQSALSGRVADLEKELDSHLVDRGVRPVVPTAAGDVLLGHARTILYQVHSAAAAVRRLDGVLTGRLNLGMINVTGMSAPVVERALALFHARHPMVEISISDPSSRGIIEGLQRGQFEIGFVGYRRDMVPLSLAHHLITDRPVVAVVATNHPLAGAREVTLAQLATSGPSIELRAGTGLRLEIDKAFARAGVVRSASLDVATTDEALRFAACGFGFALLPDRALLGRAPGDSIAVLQLAGVRLRHPVALVHQEPGPTSPSAVEFLAQLQSSLAEAASA